MKRPDTQPPSPPPSLTPVLQNMVAQTCTAALGNTAAPLGNTAAPQKPLANTGPRVRREGDYRHPKDSVLIIIFFLIFCIIVLKYMTEYFIYTVLQT